VFEGLIAGTVPVYRGSSTIAKFMPSLDSYIDASNLPPIELATLLKRTAGNKNEYNSYFNYKQKPLSEEFRDIMLKSYTHPNILCRICDYSIEYRRNSRKCANQSIVTNQ
jgi:hypothetical protein